MRTKYLCMCLLGLGLAPSVAQPQSSPNKQSSEVSVYVQQPDGELLPVAQEYSFEDNEHEGMSTNGNRRNTAVRLRLLGAKSTTRLKEGDAIQVWAESSKKIDVSRIELLRFETRGQQPITYLNAFGVSSNEGHWNTLPFRARQNRYGKWLLEPTLRLQPGEYCFTLPSGKQHFCFGVDKK